MGLLFTTLEIGFRIEPDSDWLPVHVDPVSCQDLMFQIAFSSNNDEVIADAVYAWIADGNRAGSIACHFAPHVEETRPFSTRLQKIGIHTIGCTWKNELPASVLDIVSLLDRLDAGMDDMVAEGKVNWARLLAEVIRSPTGFTKLSPHYWHLLGQLIATEPYTGVFASHDMEVMGLLEEAVDWEKLEVWMAIVWIHLPSSMLMPESMEHNGLFS